MNFKISIKLEEPLKMKTKVKVDSNNPTAVLPFESLIFQAKPNDPEGNYFVIKLNTPRNELVDKPKCNQNGLLQNLWLKIYPRQSKEKPFPGESHIITTAEELCQSNPNLQGGEVNEKNKNLKIKNSETSD